jgi:hypothetical protein
LIPQNYLLIRIRTTVPLLRGGKKTCTVSLKKCSKVKTLDEFKIKKRAIRGIYRAWTHQPYSGRGPTQGIGAYIMKAKAPVEQAFNLNHNLDSTSKGLGL